MGSESILKCEFLKRTKHHNFAEEKVIDRRQFLQFAVSAAGMASSFTSWTFPGTNTASIQSTPEGHREVSEVENLSTRSRVGIIGVGDCGCYVVEHMIQHGVRGIRFIEANTHTSSMQINQVHRMIHLCPQGRLDGCDPAFGLRDGQDADGDIRNALDGTDMLFVIAGMGGNTGSGAAPAIARMAREMGIVTVGLAITPFAFEGNRRLRKAEEWMSELEKDVNSLIVVPNERMVNFLDDDCSMEEAFGFSNDFVQSVVGGIAQVINGRTRVNPEFENARDFVCAPYKFAVGSAMAAGTHRARNAAELAISSPMFDDAELFELKRVLVLISSAKNSMKLSVSECKRAVNSIRAYVPKGAILHYGAIYDENLGDQMRVIVIAATRPLRRSPGVYAESQIRALEDLN